MKFVYILTCILCLRYQYNERAHIYVSTNRFLCRQISAVNRHMNHYYSEQASKSSPSINEQYVAFENIYGTSPRCILKCFLLMLEMTIVETFIARK